TSASSTRRLASRLGHRHDFQQVAVGILEVEAAPAATGVDVAVGGAVRLAAVQKCLGLHPAKNCLELGVADMEGVVKARAGLGVQMIRPAPVLGRVGEGQGQALVDSNLREGAATR